MAESADIINFQSVGPYEARQIARAEQQRVREAKAAAVKLKGLHATVNRLDHDIQHQESELAATRAKVRAGDAREHRPEFSPKVYWSVNGVLLVLEVPLNVLALDFLRLPQFESLSMALFVGGVTALAAKFTGRVLRQKRWAHRPYYDWGLALVFNLAFVFAIWKVAELRGRLAGDPSAGMTVFALQLVFYAAMVALAFSHIDPDGDREQLTRLAGAQERRLYGRLWPERGAIATQHNKVLADAQFSLAEIEHDAVERLMEYRDHNMRRRSEPAPTYFRQPVTRALFHPIDLGSPLDAHPREIGEVIGNTISKENEDD